jgi:hypothetical protein
MTIDDFKKHIIDKGRCTKKGVTGDVNIKVNGFGIGGSFTILFNWLILFGENVNNVYVEISDEWKKNTGINYNIFDLILEQKKIEGANEITIHGHYLHNFNNDILNYARNIINNKIKIKAEIVEKLYEYLRLNKIENLNSLCGVHVRLTDMAHYHKDIYGIVNFNTYVDEMKKIDNNVKFFIASDNLESISKLEKMFPNRISYLKNVSRAQYENETGLDKKYILIASVNLLIRESFFEFIKYKIYYPIELVKIVVLICCFLRISILIRLVSRACIIVSKVANRPYLITESLTSLQSAHLGMLTAHPNSTARSTSSIPG